MFRSFHPVGHSWFTAIIIVFLQLLSCPLICTYTYILHGCLYFLQSLDNLCLEHWQNTLLQDYFKKLPQLMQLCSIPCCMDCALHCIIQLEDTSALSSTYSVALDQNLVPTLAQLSDSYCNGMGWARLQCSTNNALGFAVVTWFYCSMWLFWNFIGIAGSKSNSKRSRGILKSQRTYYMMYNYV